MTVFRYLGLSTATSRHVRSTLLSPAYGHPAHVEVATGYGPCRSCLETFRTGVEQRILFTHQPQTEPGALPAPGPVFIHRDPCHRYDALEFPPALRHLPLVVEGYAGGGWIVSQERVHDEAPEAVITRVFAEPRVGYAHLRNGEAGCFVARVERLHACD